MPLPGRERFMSRLSLFSLEIDEPVRPAPVRTPFSTGADGEVGQGGGGGVGGGGGRCGVIYLPSECAGQRRLVCAIFL